MSTALPGRNLRESSFPVLHFSPSSHSWRTRVSPSPDDDLTDESGGWSWPDRT